MMPYGLRLVLPSQVFFCAGICATISELEEEKATISFPNFFSLFFAYSRSKLSLATA